MYVDNHGALEYLSQVICVRILYFARIPIENNLLHRNNGKRHRAEMSYWIFTHRSIPFRFKCTVCCIAAEKTVLMSSFQRKKVDE